MNEDFLKVVVAIAFRVPVLLKLVSANAAANDVGAVPGRRLIAVLDEACTTHRPMDSNSRMQRLVQALHVFLTSLPLTRESYQALETCQCCHS